MGSMRVLLCVLLVGCHTEEALTPQQARLAVPRCRAGEVAQCAAACKANGPNATCQRACDASDGEACLQLAARLERGVDMNDPERPPTPLGAVDDEQATDAYDRACRLGVKQGCRVAAARILNGQGRGKRPATAVTDLLKTGCNKLQDFDSCCMMAQLNFRLAQARSAIDAGIDFRSEGRRWATIADAYGGECPIPAGMAP